MTHNRLCHFISDSLETLPYFRHFGLFFGWPRLATDQSD